MVITGFETIEKELISNCRFPSAEVLTNPAEIAERQLNLQTALSLGNLEHGKIKIYFEDDSSCKVVETTVWGVTNDQVILKRGVIIPVNRIHSVKI